MRPLLPIVLVAGCAHAHGAHHDTHHGAQSRRFDDLAEALRMFESPERDAYQKPDDVVAALHLRPADSVADIGAGTGYFARRLARVAAAGTVYAVDIEPVLLDYVKAEAARLGLPNLVTVLAALDDARLPPGSVDVVLIVDTLHHIAERPAYLRRLAAALRPGARVVIVDYRKGPLPLGPPDEHKLSPEDVDADFAEAGFHRVATHDFLPYQYILEYSP